jgi:hypothetical protein
MKSNWRVHMMASTALLALALSQSIQKPTFAANGGGGGSKEETARRGAIDPATAAYVQPENAEKAVESTIHSLELVYKRLGTSENVQKLIDYHFLSDKSKAKFSDTIPPYIAQSVHIKVHLPSSETLKFQWVLNNNAKPNLDDAKPKADSKDTTLNAEPNVNINQIQMMQNQTQHQMQT